MTKKQPKAKAKPKKQAAPAAPKRRYNAAGMSETGASALISGMEYEAMGRAGYPWGKKVKQQMLAKVDGCRTISEIRDVIRGLQP